MERSGDWLGATRYWQDLAERLPNDERLHCRAINSALRSNQPQAAQALLDIALSQAPAAEWGSLAAISERVRSALISSHSARARECFEEQDYVCAREHFESLLRLVPDHPWAEGYLDRCYGLADDFSDTLLELDQLAPAKRVYITGCGRSGTWLLASMMGCFANVVVPTAEHHFGRFARTRSQEPVQLLKRQHDSYRFFARIPPSITVLHIVRHPFDVLTSRHHERRWHVSLERYEAESRAYLAHLKERPNTLTVRFEDLVSQPDEIQTDIGSALSLESLRRFSEFHLTADLPSGVQQAMHGVRAPSVDAIGRWQRLPENLAHLDEILPTSDGTLGRFAAQHGYDLDAHQLNWRARLPR